MSAQDRVTIHRLPDTTLLEFAERHDLTLVVTERKTRIGDPARFYARFENVEVIGDGVLIGMYGDGAEPDDALAAYAAKISLTRLAVNAFKDSRRNIDVPRLTHPPAVTNATHPHYRSLIFSSDNPAKLTA